MLGHGHKGWLLNGLADDFNQKIQERADYFTEVEVYGFVDFEVELLGADLQWFFCGDDYRSLNDAVEFEAFTGAVFDSEALALMDFVDGADGFFRNLIVNREG